MNHNQDPSPHRRPTIGVGVVVLRTGAHGPEVLLVRRAYAPRAGEWSIPGGRQEWGESLQAAARREVREETGIEIGELKLLDVVDGLFRDAGGNLANHLTLVDYCAPWTGGAPRAGDDAAEVCWVPISELAAYGLWSETVRIIKAGAAAQFRLNNPSPCGEG
jgi:ADP-ribose pyrophosphatase YjhB (NUDIX family)